MPLNIQLSLRLLMLTELPLQQKILSSSFTLAISSMSIRTTCFHVDDSLQPYHPRPIVNATYHYEQLLLQNEACHEYAAFATVKSLV